MEAVNQEMSCPCKSGKAYKACCKPLHDNRMAANSAEQLMCSRYSAFVLKNVPYLIATLHPSNRDTNDELVLKQTMAETQWLGLKIIKSAQKKILHRLNFLPSIKVTLILSNYMKNHTLFMKTNTGSILMANNYPPLS